MTDSLHENYAERADIKSGSDRGFGLTVGGILLPLGSFRWIFRDSEMNWFTILLMLFGTMLIVSALLAPAALSPVNRVWTKIGVIVGKAITPVVMLVIYVVTIIPTGLIMRAVGHDPLRLKRQSGTQSYWIVRCPAGPSPITMKDPF